MTTITKPLDITIIGGGASATLVLANLARGVKPERIGSITIYDREGRFAKGIAYSTENKLHLLNVRAANMSGFADDADHLVNWLKARDYPYDKLDFVPRKIYAIYLGELWVNAMESLKKAGVAVTIKNENYKNHSSNGVTVIASGNAFPFAVKGAEELSDAEGYHAAPWNIDYAAMKGDVIILGTGLSMIDTVMALDGAGFKGKITAISRTGLMPSPHVAPAVYPPFFEKEYPETVLGLLHDVKKHVALAAEKNIPWQAVIDSIRPMTNTIWQSLDAKEKKKLERLRTYWNIHRHRMAPEAHAIIQKRLKDGSLKIVKDKITKLEKGVAVHGRKDIYKGDVVINCLGYGSDADFKYEKDMEKRGIYALGPVMSDVYFETTAMPEIRAQAQIIASEILKA